ncbi:OmpA family protein [Yoonia litorea]|uniref:OmpA family protein n=1 Tax=Yoonia litorea TaxID=1123755 RepID=A0A1I6N2K8_9RHOB|nr:OmpA family protein [Yoonia litorea]SFS22166.1 OmpA family protein [Yoonia litorea]
MIVRTALVFAALAGMATAEGLQFPSNADLMRDEVQAVDSYALPMGIWENGALPMQTVEGRVVRQAWRISAQSLTTLQILRPLREQLRNDRFRILFECQTEACGGFDFRFAVDTFPPPEMRINIGDFRFLTAVRTTAEGEEYVTLFVSRTAEAGFVEVTSISPAAMPSIVQGADAAPLRSFETGQDVDLAAQLEEVGRSILSDLTFETGSAQLGEGPYASLQELADYLFRFPQRTVALVGHTDAEGGLEANIALSKRRAASVLERLVSVYGVPRRQLEAEGMGYLAPIGNNLTEEGREANRRVEVIVTSIKE